MHLDPIAAARHSGVFPSSLVMLWHTMTQRTIMTQVCQLIMFIVVVLVLQRSQHPVYVTSMHLQESHAHLRAREGIVHKGVGSRSALGRGTST
jgi:hypothetical protein